MDNLLTYSNLHRDNCTGEVLFKGRWYSNEEYLDLQNDIEREETEDRETEEESWAA